MIRKEALSLLTFEGFSRLYFKNLPGKSYESAYEETERTYHGYFGKRKYKSYNCFKVSLSRFLQKSNERK